MSKLRKSTAVTVALASSLSVMSTFAVGATNTTALAARGPVNGGTLNIGQSVAYNDKFIPGMDASLYTGNVDGMAFDSLLNVNNKLQFVPALAKSYTWSADKKSLTITLRNAKWSDGQPITSDDVLFTMDYLASKTYNTTLGGQYESTVDPVLGAADIMSGKKTSFAQTGGFTKINSTTFKLTFAQADAAVLWSDISSLSPIPKHVLDKVPLKDWITTDYDRKPSVVSGAYTFTAVHGQDSVEMAANPLYWAGRPHIDKIVFKTVSADVEPGELAKGDLDLIMAGLKPADVSKLKAMPGVTIATRPGMNFSYLGVKMNQPEFKDVRVRQAFQYALDRNAIIQGILKGLGTSINGPVPSVSWASATQKDGLNQYAYNVTKANQLLDAAGWRKGADGIRIDPATGKPTNLNFDITNDPTVMQLGMAIQSFLGKVGVKVKLVPLDFNALVKAVENDDKSLNMWVMSWSLGTDPDPRGIWGSNNALNFPRWKSARADQLMAKTYNLAAFDQAKRKQALVGFQLYVNQQLPYIFLYQSFRIWAYKNTLHIPDSDISSVGLLNVQDWWIQ